MYEIPYLRKLTNRSLGAYCEKFNDVTTWDKLRKPKNCYERNPFLPIHRYRLAQKITMTVSCV